MNKRQIIASLNKIANELDNNKLYAEANTITQIMVKLAAEYDPNIDMGVDDPELVDKFNRGISDTPSYIGNEQKLYNPKEFRLVVKTSDYRNNTISVINTLWEMHCLMYFVEEYTIHKMMAHIPHKA